MNKKERVLAAVKGEKVDRVPGGFWLHFPRDMHHGLQSVNAHIDFFRRTNTDILKIMNENLLPFTYSITKADDWRHIRPINTKDTFVKDQLDIIKRITDAVGDETIVITTIHGIVASSSHIRDEGMSKGIDGYGTFQEILPAHLRENPKVVSNALKVISEGLSEFTAACLEAGAQGIYYAALGGESYTFTDDEFEEYIKPNDLMILKTAGRANAFNVLHICKDRVNLNRYKDYNPDVVNWGIYADNPSLTDGRNLFPNSTIIGGLDDRSGVLVSGTQEEIEQAVFSIIDQMGTQKFILGADCTLPTEISYDRIKTAIEATVKYSQR